MLSIPLVWAILITAVLPIFVFDLGFSLQAVYLNFISGVEPNHFIAIPLFIFAGELMGRGGVGQRIIEFAKEAFGFLSGGLGIVVVVAAAGTIGIIIPPSIPLLIYGFVGNVSVADLFLAGVVPGLIFGCLFMAVCYYVGKTTGCDPGGRKTSKKALWRAFVRSFPALLMPVLILGGIFGGFVTPTEAAAVAVVYGFFVTVILYRDFSIKDMPKLIVDSFVTSAIVMVVIGATSVLGWLITLEQLPQILAEFINSISTSTFMFLLLVNVVLLLLGLVLDPVPAILLTAPLFIPTAQSFGVDPVHLGIIMTCNVAVGLFTPPVGATLYVASRISGVGVLSIARSMAPLYLAALVSLMLVTYIPAISMTLVEAFR